ncbi:MAG: hypothetical protein AAF962_06050 [Actinomycetota bacterium]
MTLEQRLQELPVVGSEDLPDLDAIRARGDQRRRRRRTAGRVAFVAALALCGVGGAAIAAAVDDRGGTDVAAPGEADATAETDAGTTSEESAPPPGETVDPDPAPVEPRPLQPGELSDGLGGALAADGTSLVHHRADGTTTVLFADLDPNVRVTDVAPIDGRPYLFIDRFEFGDGELFVVSILAVDLTTDEVIVVEERDVAPETPSWIYNSHVTTDGAQLLVARELWQGECYYTETITLDGASVPGVAEAVPAPDWLDGWDPTSAGPGELPGPCVTLGDWVDLGGGETVLGRYADADRLNDLNLLLDGIDILADPLADAEPPPRATEMGDTLGGSLLDVDGALVHRRADGTEVVLYEAFDDLGADFTGVQRWLTDIVTIDGATYLLLTEFQATENDFVNSIVAVDLTTDEIIVVATHEAELVGPEWEYFGHVTSDGTNLEVFMTWRQGACFYARVIDLAGTVVAEHDTFPRPAWMDDYVVDGAIGDCDSVDDLGINPGVGSLGRQVEGDVLSFFR